MLKIIVEENEDVELVYLVHLNPVVKDMVHNILGGVRKSTFIFSY